MDRTNHLLHPIFFLVLLGLPSLLWPASQEFCQAYASRAVGQQQANLEMNCGLSGPQWNPNHDDHYNWCVNGENLKYAAGELKRRDDALDRCRAERDAGGTVQGKVVGVVPSLDLGKLRAAGSRLQSCQDYAQQAVSQQQQNFEKNCGLAGPQWNPNYDDHYNWCMNGENLKYTAGALQQRQDALAGCTAGTSRPVESPPGTLVVAENGTDRPGQDYRSFEIDRNVEEFVGAKRCEDSCRNEPQCKAYTYVKPGVQGVNARCYLKNGVPPRVTNNCCTSGIVRPTGKADYCQNYANDAVVSSHNNTYNRCGYSGSLWSADSKPHFDWCMRASKQDAATAIAKRAQLLKQCRAPSASGDLAAVGACYDLNKMRREIVFYPLLKNVGGSKWESNKRGTYTFRYSVGAQSIKSTSDLPTRKLDAGQVIKLRGITVPFHRENTYQFGWRLAHSEDANPGNNEMKNKFAPFDPLSGYRLEAHPWLLANRACTRTPIRYWPLNLYWDKVDLNNIPLNPKWGWQMEHVYGKPDYYPDLDFLTEVTQVRYFRIIGVEAKKLGEERDFSVAITQPTSKEYGQNRIPANYTLVDIDVPGECGPHINWAFPVTYEGVLKTIAYDPNDGDLNLYLYTPDGAGTVKRRAQSHEGGIKIEFNVSETVAHFSTPWWSKLKVPHRLPSGGTVWTYDKRAVNGKYALVTAMFGLDCAHECDSELHPAWAMAIRVEDKDPGDEVWAMFARNWGNEGFCSRNIFTVNFPKAGKQRLFRFTIPWRPGATNVSVNQSLTRFQQVGGVKTDITPFTNYGVVVTFSLPEPNQRPRINGELHLSWTFPPGATSGPYPAPATALANAKAAASSIDLEDTKMVNEIMQHLPVDQQAAYRKAISNWKQSQQIPSIRETPSLPLQMNVTTTPSTQIPEVRIMQNATMGEPRTNDAPRYDYE